MSKMLGLRLEKDQKSDYGFMKLAALTVNVPLFESDSGESGYSSKLQPFSITAVGQFLILLGHLK